MKREIEFRFWYEHHRTNEKVTHTFTLSEIMNGYPFDVMSDNPMLKKFVMLDCEEQYTGLLDKNGKKIFEGDIVFWHSTRTVIEREKYEVVWQPKKCGFGLKSLSSYNLLKGMQAGKQLEVVGNVNQE